jgi:hypothetical protein
VAVSLGFFTLPSGADPIVPQNVVLSFDFSDNSLPASMSSTVNNLVCSFQPVQQGEVECAFDFTADGVWTVKAQYATDTKSAVSSVSSTSLRVTN